MGSIRICTASRRSDFHVIDRDKKLVMTKSLIIIYVLLHEVSTYLFHHLARYTGKTVESKLQKLRRKHHVYILPATSCEEFEDDLHGVRHAH